MKPIISIARNIMAIIGCLFILCILFLSVMVFMDDDNLADIEKRIIDEDISYIARTDLNDLETYDIYNLLIKACETQNLELIDTMLNQLEEIPIDFNISISLYSEDIILHLINRGIDINSTKIREGKNPETPLTYASQYSSLEKVKILIENGANIDVGFPLHNASLNGNLEIVEYLINLNMDINKKDSKGLTPIYYSLMTLGPHSYVDNSKLITFEFLLNNGSNIYNKDHDGNTLLHYSLQSNIYVIEKLLNLGLKINERNNKGAIPIQSIDNPHLYNHDLYNFMIKNGSEKIEIGNW